MSAKDGTMDDIRKLRGILKNKPAANASERETVGMSLGEFAKKVSLEWEPFGQNHDPDLWRIQRNAYADGVMRGFNECARRSERELAEAREKAEQQGRYAVEMFDELGRVQKENAAQAEEIERLRDALLQIQGQCNAPASEYATKALASQNPAGMVSAQANK